MNPPRSPGLAPLLRLILLPLAALLITGCTEVIVRNVSELNVRVRIVLPDDSAGVNRYLRANEATSTFSAHGGAVTIETMPEEEYRELLESLRLQISERLFDEGANLSAEEVGLLGQRMQEVDNALAELARQEGASCTVRAPDLSTVYAVLSWDRDANDWAISCSAESSDDSP